MWTRILSPISGRKKGEGPFDDMTNSELEVWKAYDCTTCLEAVDELLRGGRIREMKK